MNRQNVVASLNTPERIDTYLPKVLNVSRKSFKKTLDLGLVYVNGVRVNIGKTEINNGDKIVIWSMVSEFNPDQVIMNDLSMIVVNKPAGVAVQKSYDADESAWTYFDMILDHAKKNHLITANEEWHLLHRLDRDTSGLLFLAKNIEYLNALQAEMLNKTFSKSYLCLVQTKIKDVPKQFTLNRPIIQTRSGASPKFACDDRKGKSATTEVKVLARGSHGALLLQAKPLTGRTHQIRVHLADKGLPILGDQLYHEQCNPNIPMQLLHAWKVQFKHPASNQTMHLNAPLSSYFLDTLKNFKININDVIKK